MSVIWIAQEIIRTPFKNVAGLQSTLALPVHPMPLIILAYPFLQTSTLKETNGLLLQPLQALLLYIQVFHSLYSFTDDMTTRLLMNPLGMECYCRDGTLPSARWYCRLLCLCYCYMHSPGPRQPTCIAGMIKNR